MQISKILYLPIEEAVRDLDARLLLALHAVEAGWEVVFGQQWLLTNNAAHMPPGVFLFKGANRVQGNWMKECARRGHLVTACDEEATPVAAHSILQRNIDPDSFKAISYFFTQGPNHHRALLEKFPEAANMFRMVGSSRFDLLRARFRLARESRVDELRNQYGDFILINTNFGYANSNWGGPAQFEEIMKTVGFYNPEIESDRKMVQDRYEFEKTTMDAFMAMIPKLAERHPDIKIIVRPHPGEDKAIWEQEINNKVPNAEAIFEGSVVDWILASRLLIQNSCTTGIEAAFLNKPSVSFAPFRNPFFDIYTPNLVGRLIDTENELFSVVDKLVETGQDSVSEYFTQPEDFSDHFYLEDGKLINQILFEQIEKAASEQTLDNGRWEPKPQYIKHHKMFNWQVRKFNKNLQAMSQDLQKIGRGLAPKGKMKLKEIGTSLFLLSPVK